MNKELSNDDLIPSQGESNKLIKLYQNQQFEKAEKLATLITQQFPEHLIGWKVLGAIFGQSGRNAEALNANQKAVQLAPKDAIARSNLGNVLTELGRLEEAEFSFNQAIIIKPDFAEAHSNLGNVLKELGKLKEAESSFNQAIVLKPDFFGAYFNLGATLNQLGKFREATASYRNAILIKPDYAEAHQNLGIILFGNGDKDAGLNSIKRAHLINSESKDHRLLFRILQAKMECENSESIKSLVPNSDSDFKLSSKIHILKRLVEEDLTTYLSQKESLNLEKEKDPSFGNTKGSKYNLFEDDHHTIQSLAASLECILMEVFKSKIFIDDSFFSIFGAGGGTIRHNHLRARDRDSRLSLAKNKYSLVYYLSVGDQECTQPGILKFYEPSDHILPSKGLLTIFSAGRDHSSVYGGSKNRIIVGVNFYSI